MLDQKKVDTQQMSLNEKLYKECVKEKVDFGIVKDLLKKGAQPLGLYDVDEVVLNRIIYERSYDEDDNSLLYEIIKLFLDSGMEIKRENLFTDGSGDLLNPFWDMGYLSAYKAKTILDLLLKQDIEMDLTEDLESHCSADAIYIKYELEEVARHIRIMLYLSSYPEILAKNEYLQCHINYDKNNYDMSKFRNPLDFYITFDTSNENTYNNVGIIAYIHERETEKMIWTILLK